MHKSDTIIHIFTIGQYTQVIVSLYWVYFWMIIQQCMLVGNFYVKIRYNYTDFYHWSIHTSRRIVVSLYCVYCWTIIQQCRLIVDNFHAQIRYNYTHFFICFQKLYRFHAIKLFECQKNAFGIRNTPQHWAFTYNQVYSIQHTRYKVMWIANICFQMLYCFRAINLFECQKNEFGIRNIALSVHKQPSVFNTTYTILSRVNCPHMFSKVVLLSCYQTIRMSNKIHL